RQTAKMPRSTRLNTWRSLLLVTCDYNQMYTSGLIQGSSYVWFFVFLMQLLKQSRLQFFSHSFFPFVSSDTLLKGRGLSLSGTVHLSILLKYIYFQR
ncbi:MAG: hypothetical protein D3908_11590, partial [Candidatus Electrothrix sp. AUS4]|nr:hypothetical protein [Candidatus Electrothrix sp. AUS4]